MARGYVAIVLHAHLPFVRHPEHRDHLEERWLYEAIAECYLPLLDAFFRLQYEGVPFRCTVSLSPPLVAMLRDGLLRARFEQHMQKIDRVIEADVERYKDHPTLGPVTEFYLARQRALWRVWDRIDGDVVDAFAQLEDSGHIEIWTCGATHGFFPALLHHPALVRAQVSFAVDSHLRAVGRAPRGIWLPECGYIAGVDATLTRYGIAYTSLETHAINDATPRPRYGTAAPIITPRGLAAFGRDLEASRQVWSKEGGYPGDFYYREFYRDVGYDAPEANVKEFVAADGSRQPTGLKYFRITGRGSSHKEPYIPSAAQQRAWDHASDFVENRHRQIRWLADHMDTAPIVLAPYDAELFGHWWFEGPLFLENVFRILAQSDEIASTTLGEYLEASPTHDVAEPEVSSWGAGGYAGVWLDPVSGWMLRHVDHAAREIVDIMKRHARDGGIYGRAARQAMREVMLLVSSDWPFLIKTGTAPHYARARFEAHLARFRRLESMINSGEFDEPWLADVEARDNIFPNVPLDWL